MHFTVQLIRRAVLAGQKQPLMKQFIVRFMITQRNNEIVSVRFLTATVRFDLEFVDVQSVGLRVWKMALHIVAAALQSVRQVRHWYQLRRQEKLKME